MSTRQHIEIVERPLNANGTPSEQPWHVRLVRGEKTYTTEKLTRKVGAQRSVMGLAKMFGWVDPYFSTDSEGRTWLVDRNGRVGVPAPIAVLYLREMSQIT